MATVRTAVWAMAMVLGAATQAHALKPGTHADIAKASCTAAGLPRDFCTRIATEDYNTDGREWDDLRAHAQIDDGETACTAADRTAQRVYELGGALRTQLATAVRTGSDDDVGLTASAIGRALHTIQDNCAHHGMPNPQHAWASLSDFCDGTSLSPDIQDDAIACARHETDALMVAVAAAVKQADAASLLGSASCPALPEHGDASTTMRAVCEDRFLPGPIDGCGFLGRAKDWDGTDRRWENRVVVPALRDAFAAGLAGASSPRAICAGDERVLSPAVSDPVLDVSAGTPSCTRAKLLCLGKADDTDSPFADDDGAPSDAGGCSTTGTGTGSLALALALALAAVLIRRQRRG